VILLILVLVLLSAGMYWVVVAYQRQWDYWGQYIVFAGLGVAVVSVFFIMISVSATIDPNVNPKVYRGVSPIAGEIYATTTQVSNYSTDDDTNDTPESQTTLRVAGEVITVDRDQVYITTSDSLPASLYTVDPLSHHPLLLPWESTNTYQREYYLTVPTGGVRLVS